jgi:hypothetical protein
VKHGSRYLVLGGGRQLAYRLERLFKEFCHIGNIR